MQGQYIKNEAGENVAIELLLYDWPSAELESTIAKILIEEILGYHGPPLDGFCRLLL